MRREKRPALNTCSWRWGPHRQVTNERVSYTGFWSCRKITFPSVLTFQLKVVHMGNNTIACLRKYWFPDWYTKKNVSYPNVFCNSIYGSTKIMICSLDFYCQKRRCLTFCFVFKINFLKNIIFEKCLLIFIGIFGQNNELSMTILRVYQWGFFGHNLGGYKKIGILAAKVYFLHTWFGNFTNFKSTFKHFVTIQVS